MVDSAMGNPGLIGPADTGVVFGVAGGATYGLVKIEFSLGFGIASMSLRDRLLTRLSFGLVFLRFRLDSGLGFW